MILPPAKFQIGKGGVTDGTITSLSLVFKNHKQVRISMLKSSGRDRESMEKVANDIAVKLSENKEYYFDFKIIGFTIIMNRRPRQGL